MRLNFFCKGLSEAVDFDNAQINAQDGIQTCKNYHTTVFAAYQDRKDTLLLGQPDDGVCALEIRVDAPGLELTPGQAEIFAKVYNDSLQEIFYSPDNVLSLVYVAGKAGISCTAVVLPLKGERGRKPYASKFIDSHKKGSPSEDVINLIEINLKNSFPDIELSTEKDTSDLKSLGYTDYLINFKPLPYQKSYNNVLVHSTPDIDAQVQTVMDARKLKTYTNDIITYFTLGPEKLSFELSQKKNGAVTETELMQKVSDHIDRMYQMEESDRDTVLARVHRALFGNYVLDPLINDDDISDIMVLAPDNIRVKIGSKRYTSNLKFLNDQDYFRFINSLAIRNDLDIAHNAVNVFSDTRTNPKFRMRMNIAMPLITDGYPYLHIRKIAKQKRDIPFLIEKGMIDVQIAQYLVDRARNGPGMIFTGKGASGKTTLMNALLDCIPFTGSGLVIQESEELFSDLHPHLMFEHITTNERNPENRYDLQDLARNGLLTDLDYFIIGEVKGAEAKYFINAADTGHQCWCSVHSPSSLDAIDKLADYVMYETKYSKEEALYMLKSLGTVIFMKHFKVCEISELAGWDNEKKRLKYRLVYRRPGVVIGDKEEGSDNDGDEW